MTFFFFFFPPQLRTSDQTAGTGNQANQWRGFRPDMVD